VRRAHQLFVILALAGGVGGAKLAAGLARVLGDSLTVVVNTGDDFEHLGLSISPDLDTVMYTLAGLNNREQGWGLAGETWSFMSMLERLGGETWFRLGDHDLAIHVERTRRLAAGESLSAITAALCSKLGVRCRVAPMTDDRVRTLVRTDEGTLAFQPYFVRRRCEPRLEGLSFEGAATAKPGEALQSALHEARAIVLCPSNPWLSIAPILALPGVRPALENRRASVVAVSPIIGGQAVKGPAAKIMRELGLESSALEVARYYSGLVDGFVMDHADAALAPAVEALGMRALVTQTLMRDADTQEALGRHTLEFVETLSR
jgi:LPPG:FO 2-phospho-L-lactate transferase